MATSDGLTGFADTQGVERHLRMVNGIGVITGLEANLTLSAAYANRLVITPTSSHRDVNLPAVGNSEGMWFEISNFAASGLNLVVKNAGGSTIVTINQNEKSLVMCDGAVWYHTGVVTIAQT